MGHSLSRADSNWYSNHSAVNNKPKRKKRKGKKSKNVKKTSDDLYKKALVEDYNQWLRNLPPTDNDIIKEQQRIKEKEKDQTLIRKVKNLLWSKDHRKNAVIWPETKPDDDLTVVPRIQLSFQDDPYYKQNNPEYDRTSWDYYYNDGFQIGGSYSPSEKESYRQVTFNCLVDCKLYNLKQT